MTKAACGNCGIEYTFPEKISEINCACGAKVFRPKEEEKDPAPPKEEKKKETVKSNEPISPGKAGTKRKRILDKLRKKVTPKNKKSPAKEETIDPESEEVDEKLKELDKPPELPQPTADELRKETEEKRRREAEGPKEERPPEPPKEEKDLLQKLIAIPGIAKKAAEEICEEYKTVEEVKTAIEVKTFSVGGVGLFKKKLILKMLK